MRRRKIVRRSSQPSGGHRVKTRPKNPAGLFVCYWNWAFKESDWFFLLSCSGIVLARLPRLDWRKVIIFERSKWTNSFKISHFNTTTAQIWCQYFQLLKASLRSFPWWGRLSSMLCCESNCYRGYQSSQMVFVARSIVASLPPSLAFSICCL